MRPNLTHFALHVADADVTAAFYQRFAEMRPLRTWANQDGSSLKVRWLASAETANPFVLVLLQGESQLLKGNPQSVIGPLSHFGFAVDSREEVDAIAERARQAGVLLAALRDAGEIVG